MLVNTENYICSTKNYNMNKMKKVVSKEDSTGFISLNNISYTTPPVYQNIVTTMILVPAETYYTDVSEIKMILKLLLEQGKKKNEETTNESTIINQWNSCSSSLVPIIKISQKQIDKIVNIEMMASSILTDCSNLKVELHRNQKPSKKKISKPTVNLKVINNLIKMQTSPKKLIA